MVKPAEFTFKGTRHPFYDRGDKLVLRCIDDGRLWVQKPGSKYPDLMEPALLEPSNAAARRALTAVRAASHVA
jgi:hypothetical protein